MTNMTRRAALRLSGMVGIAPGLFAAAKVAPPGLVVGRGFADAAAPSGSPDILWRLRQRAMGIMLHSNGSPDQMMPAHVVALRSVRPWAKVLIARAHEDARQPTLEKLSRLMEGSR